MKQYDVTGMSCAACSARVEAAVSKVEGVTSCSVSLLTNSMGVEGTASDEAVIKAVTDAGYGAAVKGAAKSAAEDPLRDTETPKLVKRLIVSGAILLVLMYFSMGHMMWGFPAPKVFDDHIFSGTFQMLLAIAVMVVNGKFFTSGTKAVLHGAPNMDTLVALGSAASFAFSTVELFIMIAAQSSGDSETVSRLGMNLYFESAAMIPTLITVGKMLESLSKGRTTDALKSLLKLAPKSATVERDGAEREVPIEDVCIGDIFIVRSGGSVPVDGEVISGSCAVDESALTGESIPSDKETGDRVFAATIVRTGYIKCRATRVGEDTTLSQIIKTVSDAAATKAPIARIADRVSRIFVPAVIGVALLTLAVWLILGKSFSYAVARAITVLVISCPCALGLATPVAIMVGSGVGAKHGILFKTAESLEETGKCATVVLDKTGTITEGSPVVTDVIPYGVTEDELLSFAASLEAQSEHPLASAVTEYAKDTPRLEVTDTEILPGNGLRGKAGCGTLCAGSVRFISTEAEVPPAAQNAAAALAEEGKTPMFFAKDGSLIGIIAVADKIREDSAKAVSELRNMGVGVVMLTGDNRRTADAVGREAGVDEVISEVMPSDKAQKVTELKREGLCAMVGDGINDAPALALSDVGIAVGAGTDVAIDAADVVVMKSRLTDVSAALRLSRKTLKNIKENLFWAFIYNAICIPLAAGVFGIGMKPVYGAAAMSLSSFCVCMNALRLNLFNIYDSSRDKPRRSRTKKENDITKENEKMEKTMKIEGMMCPHCEARVKSVLEATDGVESAEVSHESGTARLTLTKDVPDDVLRKVVEGAGYTVV